MPMTTGNQDYRVRTAADRTGCASMPVDATVVEFLQLLGRAVRQFQTYPAASPLCIDAIDVCHRTFLAIEPGPALVCRVVPYALIIGEAEIGRGTAIEIDLARPLHKSRVASLE